MTTLAGCALLLLAAAGCQQQESPRPSAARPVTPQDYTPARVPQQQRQPQVPAVATQDPARAAEAVATRFDPCGERLHEIAGMLLQYYVQNHRLPDRLADLSAGAAPAGAVAADPDQFFRCPASGQRYVYNPEGPPIATGVTGSHLIIYDAVAAHDGARWGIAIAEPQGNQPLTARVVVIPDGMLPVALPVP
jgi:hypothetical protein